MKDNSLVRVTYQYRDILLSLIEALDTNNLGDLTTEIKKDLTKVDCQARRLPELDKLF